MRVGKRALSLLLALAMVFGLVPATLSTAVAARGAAAIVQKAEWDKNVAGNTVANVTLEVSTVMDLQTPKNVIFLIDRAASQPLTNWQSNAAQLARMLAAVPGMRYALVSYDSKAEKLLDFTADVNELLTAINGIQPGSNCNAYAGLLEAQALANNPPVNNETCIVLFSNGRFNMNLAATALLAGQLKGTVPIYGTNSGAAAICSAVMPVANIAMEIGESRMAELTVSGQLDTGNFAPLSTSGGSLDSNGTYTYTTTVQLGSTLTLSFSGSLKDTQKIGTVPVAGTASVTMDGQATTAAACSLERSGFTVSYNANGATEPAPVDHLIYQSGNTVSVKPGYLTKPGWNFSGWTDDDNNPRNKWFTITDDTTLNAAWGRAFVKLSSSTVNSGLRGQHMLSAAEIVKRYNGGFYHHSYWNYLVSINLQDSVKIPEDAVSSWDITDTNIDDANSVMAWIMESDNTQELQYELYIGGRGGLVAPEDCTKLFSNQENANNKGVLKQITGLEYLDTSEVTNMSYMFQACSGLTSLNLSNFNTSNVTNMSAMFLGCSGLTSLDLNNFNTSNVTNMERMFGECGGLTSLDLSNFNTSKVTTMKYMFRECQGLTSLNLSGFNTSNVTNMEGMFFRCKNLPSLNLSGFNTSNVSAMTSMFYQCERLTSLNLSNFDTQNVVDMTRMFFNCNSLRELDLRSFSTPKVLNMTWMFCNCFSLQTLLLDMDKFDTSRVEHMEYMFQNCRALTELDVAELKTGAVQQMTEMFDGCTQLRELNMLNWDLKNVASLDRMFQGCSNLASIGTMKLKVATACTALDFCKNASSQLKDVKIYARNNETGEDEEVDTGSNSSTPSSQSDDFLAEESEEEEGYDPNEFSLLSDYEAPASATPYAAPNYSTDSDGNGRPLYAITKAGTWDCDEVAPAQDIQYSLELQYLSEDVETNCTSGELTVTNPIPTGLTLQEDSITISDTAMRIVTGDGYAASGTIVQRPVVSEDNILTFSVTGLSAGAKYVVNYTCTAPAVAPAEYTEFLNTATVIDNGMIDYADPVLHYMNIRPNDLYTVTYRYEGDGIGAAVPPVQTCVSGTEISLPTPAVPGYTFDGWKLYGAPVPDPYTVTGEVELVGSWSKNRLVTVDYQYEFKDQADQTTPPNYIDLIWETLLADVPAEYSPNTTAFAPSLAAVPEGYLFSWLPPVDADGRFPVASKDMTITGQFERKTYPVTYAYSGNVPADAAPLPTDAQYIWGTEVTLAGEPAGTEDAIFLGWTIDGGIEADENSRFEMPMQNVTITGSWISRPAVMQEVLIDPSGGTWNDSNAQSTLMLEEYNRLVAEGTFQDAVKPDTPFLGWRETADPEGNFVKIVTAVWEPADTPEPPPVTPEVPSVPATPAKRPDRSQNYLIIATAGAGGTIKSAGYVRVSPGSSKSFSIQPADGCTIRDVLVDGESVGAVSSYTFENVRENHTIEALFDLGDTVGRGLRWLNTQDHGAYLNGYPDGTFRPDSHLTRGETAQLFYGLLETKNTSAPDIYSDIPSDLWCRDAVNALGALGIMQGAGQDRFLPDRTITRAEFTAAAMRFTNEAGTGHAAFHDVDETDWFFAPVMGAAGLGWISGYSDGTFRPDALISRAEAAAIVNRMLSRSADRSYVDLHRESLRQFPDVAADNWARYDIMEAVNAHDYHFDQQGAERWNGTGAV